MSCIMNDKSLDALLAEHEQRWKQSREGRKRSRGDAAKVLHKFGWSIEDAAYALKIKKSAARYFITGKRWSIKNHD